MNNKQFEEVEKLLQSDPKRANACPTCNAKAIEPAPGVQAWGPSTYLYEGKHIECHCEEQRALWRHYLLAHIPEEYMRLNCKHDYYGDPDALKETQTYLDNWDNNRVHGMGLGFYSNMQGTGKTFLATYVGKDLLKRGESVFFCPFLSIVNIYSLPFEDRKSEEDRLRNCTILILDEIVPSISEAQRELFASKFEELLRHRSNYNRVTLLTTNLEPKELDEEYARTFSILSAKQHHVIVKGDDARREGIWDVNKELAENGEIRPLS
jgi:DNA replication protein DnaC